MKKILLGCLLALGMTPTHAQVVTGSNAERLHPSAEMLRYDDRTTAPLYVKFKQGAFVAGTSGMEAMQQVLQSGAADSWQLIRTDADDLGMQHARYQQYYNNVKVITGEYILHLKQGNIVAANGLFYRGLQLNTNPALNEKAALDAALRAIGASKYLWQSSAAEQEILSGHNHGSAYPKGELVVLPKVEFNASKENTLCWRFDIYAMEPHERWYVYVNAQTGEIIFKENRICTITVNATAATRYSGSQTFQVDSLAATSYRLRDYSRGSGVETYNLANGTTYVNTDFTDTDKNWTPGAPDNAALDAHWGTQKTYDYYFGIHGRNSYNNAGAVLRSYVHYSSAYNNAFWNGSVMTYGDGDGSTFSPLTELDIVAHELTHGVTNFSSNLVYSYQSGALNESFSDIFGVTVDFFARPAQANWTMADQSYTPATPGDGIRYMNNPNLAGDPDTYLGTNWYTGAGDNGGVHYNSGVQNFWYYLLCVGGTGTNDFGFAYNVASVTMAKARMIAYRNNSFYLTSGSQYADAAYYSLQAATDLYGPCSPEAYSVKNAWDAVGVYGLSLNANATASVTGGACAGSTIQFSAAGGTTYQWSGPGGFSSTSATPSIANASAANNGTYTCIVTAANGCSGTASVTVNVGPAPSVSATGGVAICNGGTAQLQATASVPGQGGNIGVNTTALPIPDSPNPGVTSNITISGSSNANAVIAVTIDSLTHTYDADLKIELIAPNGSLITLANGVGGSGDNFIRTRLVTGGTALTNGVAPFTGNFAPQTAFSNLTGSANGVWGLRITDLAGVDVGTLWKWTLELPGNSISSYSWNPSTGLNNASIANPVASPPSTTIYTCTVTDNNGCTAAASTTVTIGTLSTTASSTGVTCNGAANGTATVSAAGTPTYQWSNGANTSTISGLTAGSYTCTVSDGSGCTAVQVVTVSQPQQLEGFITTQNANCGANDGSAYLTIYGGTAPFTILWSNGATTPNISGLGAGTYSATVTDANGCTFFTSGVVSTTGTNPPATPGSITGTKNGVCPGVTKTYSCPSVANASTYTWTVPANAVINSGQGTNSISVTFQNLFTTGPITVTAGNSCGTSNAKSATIRSTAQQPGTITGPANNLCNSVTTYSIPASTTGATSYTWSVPAGASIITGQGTTSIQVQWPTSPISGGSICVTANNACGSSTARCKASLTTLPLKPTTITGPTSVCANQANLTYSVATQPGVTYTWTVPSGATLVSGQGTGTVVVNWRSTTGLLKVKAGNACATTSDKSQQIVVSCREGNFGTFDAALMPNPGNGQATIRFNVEPGDYVVTVSDMLGQTILRESSSQRNFNLNLTENAPGVYLVQILNGNGDKKVVRMIISE